MNSNSLASSAKMNRSCQLEDKNLEAAAAAKSRHLKGLPTYADVDTPRIKYNINKLPYGGQNRIKYMGL